MARKNHSSHAKHHIKTWKINNPKSRLEELFDCIKENKTEVLTKFKQENLLQIQVAESVKKESVVKDEEKKIAIKDEKKEEALNIVKKISRKKKEHIKPDYYKLKDEYGKSLLDISSKLSEAVKLIDLATKSSEHISKQLSKADKEIGDLHHEIECIWEDARGGYVRYDQLKHVLLRRRAYKELMEECSPIADFVRENQQSYNKLKGAVTYINSIVELRNSEQRGYVPRVRDDLKIAKIYNEATPELQQIMKINSTKKRSRNRKTS